MCVCVHVYMHLCVHYTCFDAVSLLTFPSDTKRSVPWVFQLSGSICNRRVSITYIHMLTISIEVCM